MSISRFIPKLYEGFITKSASELKQSIHSCGGRIACREETRIIERVVSNVRRSSVCNVNSCSKIRIQIDYIVFAECSDLCIQKQIKITLPSSVVVRTRIRVIIIIISKRNVREIRSQILFIRIKIREPSVNDKIRIISELIIICHNPGI